MKVSQFQLLISIAGAIGYRFRDFYTRLYSKLFFPESSTYIGGDLKNKGRYFAFKDLFCNVDNGIFKTKSISFLGRALRRKKLANCEESNLKKLADIILSDDEESAKAKIQLLLGPQHANFSFLSLEEMMLCEYGFLEIGLFIEAAECHSQILKKICSAPESKKDSSRLKSAASIELETLTFFSKYSEAVESSHKDLFFYLRLLRDSLSSAIRFTNFKVSSVNNNFYKSISGSKVLILGPRANLNELEAGDEFDAIVVMNYHGPVPERDKIIASAFKKARTTLILYFANDVSKLLSSKIKEVHWDYEPDFIVTKSNQFSFQHAMLRKENSRTLNTVDALLVLGSGNFLQQCLYDLLCFNPGLVKIIGLDFWVGSSTYSKGYKIQESDEKFPKYSFAAHNVFSNFLFPKALKKAGILECSDVVGSVLDLELKEYAERLGERYPFG